MRSTLQVIHMKINIRKKDPFTSHTQHYLPKITQHKNKQPLSIITSRDVRGREHENGKEREREREIEKI